MACKRRFDEGNRFPGPKILGLSKTKGIKGDRGPICRRLDRRLFRLNLACHQMVWLSNRGDALRIAFAQKDLETSG